MRFLTTTTLSLLGLSAVPLWAACDSLPSEVRPVSEAKVFIEDNAGAGDIGVHAFLGVSGWTELCLFDPNDTLIMHLKPQNALSDLGLSEIFWESVEPPYTDWGFEDLKAAFPEGSYTVKGAGKDGKALLGTATFTTTVPLMPNILEPATILDEEGDVPAVPHGPVTVAWDPVTQARDGRDVTITGYQIIVILEGTSDPNGFSGQEFNLHVAPEVSRVVIPEAFLRPASLYELEVIAIEQSGNQTIGGSSFFRTE